MQKRTAEKSRWSESEARRVLADWRSSGETLSAFARGRGLHPQRLSWWARRIECAASPPVFLPVSVREEARGEEGAIVAYASADGEVRVEVRRLDAASARWVALLSRALSGAS